MEQCRHGTGIERRVSKQQRQISAAGFFFCLPAILLLREDPVSSRRVTGAALPLDTRQCFARLFAHLLGLCATAAPVGLIAHELCTLRAALPGKSRLQLRELPLLFGAQGFGANDTEIRCREALIPGVRWASELLEMHSSRRTDAAVYGRIGGGPRQQSDCRQRAQGDGPGKRRCPGV